MESVFILLIVFQIKHFLADYPLQTKGMLGKFSEDKTVWVPALFKHCWVHFAFTSAIVLVYTVTPSTAMLLGALDFIIHFIMDRIKASPNILGKFKPLYGDSYKAYLNLSQGYDAEGRNIPTDFSPQASQRNKELINIGKHAIRGNMFFWWSLGLDQAVHHLTHYLIIYLMVRG